MQARQVSNSVGTTPCQMHQKRITFSDKQVLHGLAPTWQPEAVLSVFEVFVCFLSESWKTLRTDGRRLVSTTVKGEVAGHSIPPHPTIKASSRRREILLKKLKEMCHSPYAAYRELSCRSNMYTLSL